MFPHIHFFCVCVPDITQQAVYLHGSILPRHGHCISCRFVTDATLNKNGDYRPRVAEYIRALALFTAVLWQTSSYFFFKPLSFPVDIEDFHLHIVKLPCYTGLLLQNMALAKTRTCTILAHI